MEALQSYSWPGNVRELRNAVVKSALAAEGDAIVLRDLPPSLYAAKQNGASQGRTLDDLEQQAILSALSETGGRQDRAARLLGISQRTLIRKLKLYNSQDTLRTPIAMVS
jgi:DNA-binding NtrC family response regulator